MERKELPLAREEEKGVGEKAGAKVRRQESEVRRRWVRSGEVDTRAWSVDAITVNVSVEEMRIDRKTTDAGDATYTYIIHYGHVLI